MSINLGNDGYTAKQVNGTIREAIPVFDALSTESFAKSWPSYQAVAASQSAKVLGATGAAGDILGGLIITVGTAATAATSITDGAGSAIPIVPNSVGGGIETLMITFGSAGLKSTSGAWKITTGAGSTVLAFGSFT